MRRMLWVIACVMLLLLAWCVASQGQEPEPAFVTDFESGEAIGWELDPGWRVVEDEQANLALSGDGHAWAWLEMGQGWADYSLGLRFKLLSGEFQSSLRVSDRGRYAVALLEDHLYLLRESPWGEVEHLAESGAEIGLGQWHALEILAEGGLLSVFVDGELRLEYLDEQSLPHGSIALHVPEEASVVVDDVLAMVHSQAELDLRVSDLFALRREAIALAAGEHAMGTLDAADRAIESALQRAQDDARRAEAFYRESIVAGLREALVRQLEAGEAGISEEQFEGAMAALDEAQLGAVNTAQFLDIIKGLRLELVAGTGMADLALAWYDIPNTTLKGIEPSPPLTDRATQLSILIKNTGFVSVTKAFTLTLHVDGKLEKEWTIKPVAEQEDPAHAYNPLEPGQSRVVNYSVNITGTGQHTLLFEVDKANEIPESDDTINNVLQASPVWQQPPNLTVKSVSPVSPPVPGQKSVWKIEVENGGEGGVMAPFLTTFAPQVPGGSHDHFWANSLAAGATLTFTSTQSFQAAGTYSVRAMADATYAVVETSPGGEKDNEWVGQFGVVPVDLAVDKVIVGPQRIVSWQPMTVTVVVKNAGKGSATTPFAVRVLPGTVSATGLTTPKDYQVKALKANEVVTLTHSVTLWPGKHTLSIMVDPAGVYYEKDGTNNNRVQTVHCEGMRGGRVYDVDGNIKPQEMQAYVDHDPLLQPYQKKVATVALTEAQSPLCDGAAQSKYDASGAWCSEFVAWVLRQAGMKNIKYCSAHFMWCWNNVYLDEVTLNKELVKLFDRNGNRFKWRDQGQVTPQTANVGDYVSLTTLGKKKNHAAICVGVLHDNTKLFMVHGNAGKMVDGVEKKCVRFDPRDYFPDGKTCNDKIDGIGKLDAGLF